MGYTVDPERIRKVAEELGLKVTFNNPPEKCGYFNSKTGERQSFNEIQKEIFELLGVSEN